MDFRSFWFCWMDCDGFELIKIHQNLSCHQFQNYPYYLEPIIPGAIKPTHTRKRQYSRIPPESTCYKHPFIITPPTKWNLWGGVTLWNSSFCFTLHFGVGSWGWKFHLRTHWGGRLEFWCQDPISACLSPSFCLSLSAWMGSTTENFTWVPHSVLRWCCWVRQWKFHPWTPFSGSSWWGSKWKFQVTTPCVREGTRYLNRYFVWKL